MTQSSKSDFITGIGPIQAISLVVGSMIGSGIFIVSADIGRQMNAWGPGGLMLVWVITGLMTLAGALSYAELAGMMPKAGGQYVFLREGIAPWAGFLYGCALLGRPFEVHLITVEYAIAELKRRVDAIFSEIAAMTGTEPPSHTEVRYRSMRRGFKSSAHGVNTNSVSIFAAMSC